MRSLVVIPLNTTPAQAERLRALRVEFAKVCNALAPVVQQTRTWNRVALHHMAYRQLREQFPGMGSQMVCNAIYSVSRMSRMVFQHPASPFNITRLAGRPLPLMTFMESCPVYFDRHTLSLKDGQLSMFTLDGRMRFQLAVQGDAEKAFHTGKLREIVLGQRPDGQYQLSFHFDAPPGEPQDGVVAPQAAAAEESEIPEYLIVEEATP